MAQFDIRKFRHAVSVLKKQGVIPANVDARSAQPHFIRGGKPLREYVKKHAAKVEAVDKRKKASTKISIVHLPVEYHNLEQYLLDIKDNSDVIDRMKANREHFAFRFFGHQSYSVYSNIDLLIEDLMKYQTVEHSLDKKSARDMNEVYKNLAIVRVPQAAAWHEKRETKVRKRTKAQSKQAAERRRKKAATAPEWKKKQAREQNAARQRTYREGLSKSEKEAYKVKARKRAAKSDQKK